MIEDPLDHGGYSIFHETMADMTFREIERAARSGAVPLWGLGVIEQHGPHLPLGTDVYVPMAVLRLARRLLASRRIESVIVPPCYWGVNHVTASYAGSFLVRPAVFVDLMTDVFASLKKDGFQRVFCISGHGDAVHNRTILDGVRQGSAAAAIDGRMVVTRAMAARLGFDSADTHLAIAEEEGAAPGGPIDVHAGRWETSLMWAAFPEVVRSDVLPELAPTDFAPADLAEWRKGGEHAQGKSPLGYVGDPAAANREHGLGLLQREAALVADAVAAALESRG
ncbi:MAG: creatininase family protein [Stellaceae bacterium]